MKIFAPDYFGNFKCLMGECKHTCCADWEIDIDSETAEYYKNVPGEFGKKLCSNIDFDEDNASFVLCKDGRCPFLNEKGLCEIILNLGEDSLCQVCDDHPRFRNFYISRTEIGFGLCCEAAEKLVLEKEEPTKIIEIDDDGFDTGFLKYEENFFALRKKIFEKIQDREKDFSERVEDILELCSAKLPEKDFGEWAEIFLGLEMLEEKWAEILEGIKENPKPPEIKDPVQAEQLLSYFIFRHLYPDYLSATCAFAVLSLYMTEKAAEQCGIFEAARLFSSEIEYSDENIDIILKALNEGVF